MIHERISLVFILLLDIAPNFNIYEDVCHAQPSSEHFSSYAKYILYPRLRRSVSSIYKSFDTEGHFRNQCCWGFFLLKTVVSFNSGKIKVENSFNYYFYLSPFEMQKCNRIIVLKKQTRNLKHNDIGALMAAYTIFDSILLCIGLS